MKKTVLLLILCVMPFTCSKVPVMLEIDAMAISYVKLCLHIGQYDPDYVDAYFGPEKWIPAALDSSQSADTVLKRYAQLADSLIDRLAEIDTSSLDTLWMLRFRHLERHLTSARTRIDILLGKTFTFDQESKGLYDVVIPDYPVESLAVVIEQLDDRVPGAGDLGPRLEAYRKRFDLPGDKISALFETAMSECRTTTRRYIPLPEDEVFTFELVSGQPWGAYNWYRGDFHSLIQINTSVPVSAGSMLRWAAHEGYPGHHTHQCVIERELYQERGWVEFSILPLYAPRAVVAEGTANYAVDLLFPGEARTAYYREVLFPMAGFEPAEAGRYLEITNLAGRLRSYRAIIARDYLDGRIDRKGAMRQLVNVCLSRESAANRTIQFWERYRTYVVTYVIGEELVRDYVERHGGEGNSNRKWELFYRLLATPRTASLLR